MRLGDLDALKEGLNYHFYPTDQEYETDRQWAVGYNAGLNRALHSIAYAKTIDAVPVVRCKDCKNGKRHIDGFVTCSHPAGRRLLMGYFDFCSYGERKDGAG